ncbi:MAG TPA: peptidoglycan DD-metalloendopeptidase family protein [Chitinophagales bacterium]|nr:peptidoglycan DD-metalloendopeptidase family protein [Chitinophagales bacterium]
MNNTAKIKKYALVAVLALFVGVIGVIGVWAVQIVMEFVRPGKMASKMTAMAAAETEEEPVVKYGMVINDFKVLNHVVKPNELFSQIFSKYNVTYDAINFFVNQSPDVFNLRKIKAGNCFTVLCEKTDTGLVPKKLVYEESKVNYVVFNLEDSLYMYRGQNSVERVHREVSGVIRSSLYETLEENNIDPQLAVRMSEIFAWSVDFYKIQNGDKFKIIYDEDMVDGKSVAIGEIKAIVFNSGGKDNYAFYYEKEASHEGDYYDENGNSMKKQFLKSPVKFSRISSRFSMKRFHPVTKAWKAHLGTDYAAAYGTPILATADGVIEDAQFKVYNGNYVKIRHNGQYKTQYLHMSKIAKGIRRGVRVKQGEVIGYVGSTGLATGPHVCYRFWKDGSQVDPFKEKLGFAEALPAKYKSDFLARTKPVKVKLDAINYEEHNIAVQKQAAEEEEKQAEVLAGESEKIVKRFF